MDNKNEDFLSKINIKQNGLKIYNEINLKNSQKNSMNNLDLSIKEKSIEKIIIYFSKISYFLDTKNLTATQYKKNFDLILSKLEQIKIIFENEKNKQLISNLIIGCIKKNIVSQIYLYVTFSQIIFDKGLYKSEEIIYIIDNLYSSLLFSNDKYYLVLFFASYYILINIKKIFNYINSKKTIQLFAKLILIMNRSYAKYYIISKELFIDKSKESNERSNSIKKAEDIDDLINNEYNINIEKELNMLFNLMSENLDIINNDLLKINKQLFKEYIFDCLYNSILVEKENNNNCEKKDKYFYNNRLLDYILNNIKNEYLIVVLDRLVKLLNEAISIDLDIFSKLNKLISNLFSYYLNNSKNEDISKEINENYISSLNSIIKLSKDYLNIMESNSIFQFNDNTQNILIFTKNLLLFTIQSTENYPIEKRIFYINLILNILLIFLKNNFDYDFTEEDLIIFNLIFQEIKKLKFDLFNFKSLIDIISFLPINKKTIYCNTILEELINSQFVIDNNLKANFVVSLIKNLSEINKDTNNKKETLSNLDTTLENYQTIIKINKLILCVNNNDLNELLQLIFILGNIYSDLTISQKALTCNSFYQKLINISQLAIKEYITKKNYESSFSIITGIYSVIQDYISNTFQYLFEDNRRIILECISYIDKIKDEELRKKLAVYALEFARLYIKIILKQKALENEKEREEIEQYYNEDEFDFGSENEEEEKDENIIKNFKKKISKKEIIENEKNLKKTIEEKEKIKNKNKLKIKNFSDSLSLMIISIEKLIKILKRTTIFNIKIQKELLINGKEEYSDSEDSDDEENEDKIKKIDNSENINDESTKESETNKIIIKNINNEEKNEVTGYNIIIEDLTKIKGKRVDTILIKINLIEIYYHIKDFIKINSLFLEVKEETSFLNNNFEILGIISLILDKIVWFTRYDPDILEKSIICVISKFINERNVLKNIEINNNDKDIEKQKELFENQLMEIKVKNNEIIKFLNNGNKDENKFNETNC